MAESNWRRCGARRSPHVVLAPIPAPWPATSTLDPHLWHGCSPCVQAHASSKDKKLVCCMLCLVLLIGLMALLLILKIVNKVTGKR